MRRLVSLAIVSCLWLQTFASPLLVVRSPKRTEIDSQNQQGAKHKMTTEKKLQQFYSKRGYKDPMLPVLMHGLKRHLAGAQNPTEFDKLVGENLKKYQIGRNAIEAMVKNWDLLPSQFKAQWFPKELLNLDPKRPLDLKLFSSLVLDAARKISQPKNRIPLPRNFPGITPPPRITEVRTSGLDFALVLRSGSEFTLFGRNFSPTAAENRIQIGRVRWGSVEFEVLNELRPTSASATELRAIAPPGLTPGSDYNVRVIVNGATSNQWQAYVETPPAPAARLDSVSPGACQYPGQRVLLRGDNFMADSIVELEFIDADVTRPDDLRAGYRYIRSGRPSVDFRNRNEIYFTIPQETWPGDYSLSVRNPGASSSLHQTFTVCTPSYRVELESIRCIDESDPEWTSDDEVAVIAHGNADGDFTADAATDEISGFSDGTRQPRRGAFRGINLFSRAGAGVPVKYSLGFTYLLLEVDDYNKAEAIALVSALGGIADGAVALIGAIAGAAAATIGAITGGLAIVVGLVIVAILLTSNPPDLIGGQVDLYTARDLQTGMTSVDGSILLSRRIAFNNDDDTGSYELAYRIIRSRE